MCLDVGRPEVARGRDAAHAGDVVSLWTKICLMKSKARSGGVFSVQAVSGVELGLDVEDELIAAEPVARRIDVFEHARITS